MAWRPNPVKLVCTRCKWKKTVAPKSDVVLPDYVLKECPKCGSKLRREKDESLLSVILRLLGR